jgi:putative intracellular protease/amidase
MPWYLEAALRNRGTIFDGGDAAWVSHVVIDRNLVTAQNPGSTDAAAYAMLKRLKE